MTVSLHSDIEHDLRKLKRFPAAQETLEAWVRLFCVKGLDGTTGIDQYPGFGQRKIYKARVVPLKENIGKLGGYRLIFEITSEQDCIILVFSRHGIYKTEQELANLIRLRIVIK